MNEDIKDIAIYRGESAAESNLLRAKRQSVLMGVIQKDKKPLTLEQMAYEMRKDKWIQQNWPEYGAHNASRDLRAIIALVEGDIKDLAVPYIVRQMGIMEDTIATLQLIVNDLDASHTERIRAANTLRSWVDMEISVMGNYPAQRLEIDKREIKFDLDAFLAMKEKVEKQFPEIVDGAFEEEE